ncbi:MAG TPA: prepilin-type N-terminal cleavage/methylation domain-containing protein [Polyangia bacterium]|jgi:general secretion pathway protein I|nr:prepilin-type N-terminal cleavage/methylation domain-containing protein [Polyangia bacterium]
MATRRRPGRGQGGFTLLEMMIATAILALALTTLVDATTRAINAANHAKLVSTATFLARSRLVDLEDQLAEKGFTDDSFAKEESGDFDDKGFKRFRWTVVVDKVELPATDQVQTLVSKALTGQQTQAGGGGLDSAGADAAKAGAAGGGLGAGASSLASQFGIIKDVLEQGIRRVKVTVAWQEAGQPKTLEVVEYLTDPRRVDQSIQFGGPGGIPGLGGAGGVPGAGGIDNVGKTGGGNPAPPGGKP